MTERYRSRSGIAAATVVSPSTSPQDATPRFGRQDDAGLDVALGPHLEGSGGCFAVPFEQDAATCPSSSCPVATSTPR